jgi:hypothetical protein
MIDSYRKEFTRRFYARDPRVAASQTERRQGAAMTDIVFLALTAIFFAASFGIG